MWEEGRAGEGRVVAGYVYLLWQTNGGECIKLALKMSINRI